MKFGLSFLPDCDDSKLTASDYFSSALSLARLADQSGMSRVKMTEHYFQPYGGYCPSPLLFLTAVSAHTNKIRLLTGGLLANFHHPIMIASSACLTDVLTQGRLDLGFARAYLPYEFDAFGVELDDSREKFTATIDAVLALLSSDGSSAKTPFFSFPKVSVMPRSIQRPHPPVWITAVRSRESFAWIGQMGFNLLVTTSPASLEELRDHIEVYREAFAASRNGGRSYVALSMPMFIDRDGEVALRNGEIFLKRYLDVWINAAESWAGRTSSSYPGYAGMAQALRRFTPERMINECKALVGAIEQVRQGIQTIEEITGIDEILLQVDFGSMPPDLALRNLDTFLSYFASN